MIPPMRLAQLGCPVLRVLCEGREPQAIAAAHVAPLTGLQIGTTNALKQHRYPPLQKTQGRATLSIDGDHKPSSRGAPPARFWEGHEFHSCRQAPLNSAALQRPRPALSRQNSRARRTYPTAVHQGRVAGRLIPPMRLAQLGCPVLRVLSEGREPQAIAAAHVAPLTGLQIGTTNAHKQHRYPPLQKTQGRATLSIDGTHKPHPKAGPPARFWEGHEFHSCRQAQSKSAALQRLRRRFFLNMPDGTFT